MKPDKHQTLPMPYKEMSYILVTQAMQIRQRKPTPQTTTEHLPSMRPPLTKA